MANRFKRTDIKISKDRQGCFTAKHLYHGILINSAFYSTEKSCYLDAVDVLQDLKDHERQWS